MNEADERNAAGACKYEDVRMLKRDHIFRQPAKLLAVIRNRRLGCLNPSALARGRGDGLVLLEQFL